jgi:hypothetical protein
VNRLLHPVPWLVALTALFSPAAGIASPGQVIHDCADDGTLSGRYSNAELRNALDSLPADLDEYSDCREVIGAAIKGGSDKGDRGGDPAAISPREQAAREADARALERIVSDRDGASAAIEVGGKKVRPGSNGLFDIASGSNELPTALLVALIAIGLLAVSGAIVALRGRMPALAHFSLPSKLSTPRVPFPRRRR